MPLQEEHYAMTAIRNMGDKAPSPDGLTARDLFAMSALDGILASYTATSSRHHEDAIAEWAYEMADAMIRQRGAK